MEEGLTDQNIVRTIQAPKANVPLIEPFNKEQIEAILKACEQSNPWKPRAQTRHTRSTADRDRAIVLLLDTGLRASELCALKISDVNIATNQAKIIGGKGGKDRIVLRNGGDVFTLQELLGHVELEMVRRYARVAQVDCAAAHRQASPVDNWKL